MSLSSFITSVAGSITGIVVVLGVIFAFDEVTAWRHDRRLRQRQRRGK